MARLQLLIIAGFFVATSSAEGEVLFKEAFDGKMKTDWKWVRGDKDEWRIRANQLHMRAQHGKIWGGNDAKNLLLVRPTKNQGVAASVSVAHEPKELWEQAGLLWYVDDDNFIKLISEHIKGEMFVVMARELQGRGKVICKIPVSSPNMQLRLKVGADSVVSQWRLKEDDDWSKGGSCQFDADGKKWFGLFSQNGPENEVRWIRYDNFSIITD